MKNRKLTIILDPAHGIDTYGKRSPDGTHREYKWSRDICEMLYKALENSGYQVHYTTPSLVDVALSRRVKNTQKINSGGTQKLLISLHNNAAGDGEEWKTAKGVEIYTSPKTTYSDTCATTILNQLSEAFPELVFRKDLTDGDVDKEAKFTILMGSGYAAVLLEWLFQDNKEEVELLKDEITNKKLVDTLLNAINILNNQL